jgi:hypothetical protein
VHARGAAREERQALAVGIGPLGGAGLCEVRESAHAGVRDFCQSAHFTVHGAFAGERWLRVQPDGLAGLNLVYVLTVRESCCEKKKAASCFAWLMPTGQAARRA